MSWKAGVLLKDRREIITEALLIQIDNTAIRTDLFTSEDILIVVNISKADIEGLREDFNSRIDEFLESIGIS